MKPINFNPIDVLLSDLEQIVKSLIDDAHGEPCCAACQPVVDLLPEDYTRVVHEYEKRNYLAFLKHRIRLGAGSRRPFREGSVLMTPKTLICRACGEPFSQPLVPPAWACEHMSRLPDQTSPASRAKAVECPQRRRARGT